MARTAAADSHFLHLFQSGDTTGPRPKGNHLGDNENELRWDTEAVKGSMVNHTYEKNASTVFLSLT